MSLPWRRSRPWIATAIGLGVLALGIHWVGIRPLAESMGALSRAGMATAFVAIVVGTVLGGWNCFRIAELRSHLPFRAFLPVYWRAWAIGLSVPGQVGDLLWMLWQLRGRTGSLAFLAGRLITDKLVTISMILLLAALLPAVFGWLPFPLWLLPPVATAVAVVLLLWAARAAGRRFGANAWGGWRARLATVAGATEAPTRALLINACVTGLKLVLTGLAYWAVLAPAATRDGRFLTVLAISQSAGLVAYIPVSFNGIGTVELSAIHLFGMAGFDPANVLAAYVYLRVAALAAAWLPVAALWLHEGLAAGRDAGPGADT